MVAPIIPIAGVLAAAYAIPKIFSAWQDLEWQSAYQRETKQFWDNYERITGVKVKYEYRAGKTPNPSYYWRDIATMVGAGAGAVAFLYGANKNFGSWRPKFKRFR